MSQPRMYSKSTTFRRRAFSIAAAVGGLTFALTCLAPVAVAADARSQQWYLDAMGASEIWRHTTGKGISVAVIDGGVNPSTPSLKGQVVRGVDVAGIAGEATDDYDGHGTTMAELIAGTGKGGGLQGLAPGAKIIPIRTLVAEMRDKEAPGRLHTLDKAIRAAADSDAQIINISLGQNGWDDDTKKAVEYAAEKGKVMFSSVGNEAQGVNNVDYPAGYPDVVGVAAIDAAGQVASFSEHGREVHLAAPGVKIPSWCDETFKRYCVSQGTSQATAIASASAALIWSAHPDWTANQVLRVMFESAARAEGSKKGTLSNYLGHGVVRPGAHINRGLGKPGDPNISPLTNEKTGASSGSSASPTPSAPASSQAPKGKPGADAVVAGSSSESSNDSGQLGLVLGTVAALAVIGGGAFVLVRKRRST